MRFVDELPTPVGPLTVVTGPGGLLAVRFASAAEPSEGAAPSGHVEIRARLAAYFEGDLQAIETIAVAPAGTAFQLQVWHALREIRAGATWSYSQLAARIGRPAAIRAVGAANGANPIPIVLPCHRVIGSNGRLVGYGGGLERKQWLLAHEGLATPRLL